MRRMLVAAAMVGLMVSGSACQPAEPAMTITAKPDAYPIAATTSHVTGKVTPATATTKVVLQRTVKGKWVDWQACPASEICGGSIPAKVPQANVNKTTGAYSISYPVQWCGVILHLRVRSNGGTKFSPGFYTQADPGESC